MSRGASRVDRRVDRSRGQLHTTPRSSRAPRGGVHRVDRWRHSTSGCASALGAHPIDLAALSALAARNVLVAQFAKQR